MICQCGKEIPAGATFAERWLEHLNGQDGSTCGKGLGTGVHFADLTRSNARSPEDAEMRLAIMALNDTVKAMHAEIRELRREVRYKSGKQMDKLVDALAYDPYAKCFVCGSHLSKLEQGQGLRRCEGEENCRQRAEWIKAGPPKEPKP